MGRAIRFLLLAALGASVVGGCGGDANEQLADANVTGQCPSQQLEKKAATFSVQVENKGEKDWPAVFVEWNGISSVSVVEDKVIDGSGNKGEWWGGRGFTTYRFGPLAAGATQSYELTVIPSRAANKSEVTFAAWGDEPDGEAVPRFPEIEIHDCNGPWGDGK